jgi:Protein of unknown function (DUF3168)
MSGPPWALQQALHAVLESDAALKAEVTGIFDHVPQDQPLPYVVIGDDVTSDWSAKDFNGTEHRLAIHVWAHGPGRKQARQLGALIAGRLATTPLQPAGFQLVSLRFLQTLVLVEEDGLTHHGVTEYRARLCPL